MKKIVALLLAIGLVATTMSKPAAGFAQFSKQFKLKYLGDESTPEQQKLAAAVKVAKCFVCHGTQKNDEGKTEKANRNAYGRALHKFLSKKDKTNVEKIQKALEQVESMKAEGGATFGAMLKQGRLPVAFKPQ